jgi:hypothetical protein
MSRGLACTLGVAAVVALTASPALAQRVGDDRGKRLHATRISTRPVIDGRLDDATWKEIAPDTRFTQNFPDEGRPPSQRTELYVGYDDRALYIGVRAWDTNPRGIVERLTRRDRDTDADKIEVEVSSKNDRITAYHFSVNVSGVLQDGVRFDDTNYSGDWDGLWLGAAHRDANGWTAELAIPFQTLRYEGGHSEFGFQVRRQIQRRQETDEWAYVPRAARGEVSYYGTLDGLAGLHATRLFQIVPYLAAGVYLRSNQDPAQLNGTQLYGNIGADVKLGLTPALTLDATINPDFGQVEADQVVLNLSTFEVFFPEKRPFFLEGVDVFATPLTLFYSRRIGSSPLPPDTNHYTVIEPEQPGRIYAAAKLSGLVAPRLTIGALDAVTAESSTVATRLDAPDRTLRLSTEPLSNYALVRLKRDIFAHSYVGLMATAVNRFERPGVEAPQAGDFCPDGSVPAASGRCTHDAYSGGVDFNLRSNDGDWAAMGQVAATVLAGGPQRLVPDGTLLGPGTSGVGVAFEGGKYNGVYNGQLEYRAWSPGFDNNDMGFNQQANQHNFRPHLHYRILKPVGIILDGDINVSAMVRYSWDFHYVLQQEYWVGEQLRFKNFWTLYFEVDYDTDRWDLREARDGTAVRRSGGWLWLWQLKTDPRKKIWAQSNGSIVPTQHGRSVDLWMQLALRPLPAIELDIIPHTIFAWGDPRWFDTRDNGDGTNTYYFADLDSREVDVTLRGTYTFTPTLTLQAYAQLFLAGGHYGQTVAGVAAGKGSELPFHAFRPTLMPSGDAPDFRDGAINVNLVLRWEFLPGSTILGVYTHAQGQTAFDPLNEGFGRPSLSRFTGGAATDLFLIKLSLLVM